MTTINTKALIARLETVQDSEMTLEAVALIVDTLVSEDEWVGLPATREYTIAAPLEPYQDFDHDGKAVVVRDYFRELADSAPGDVVTVQVQPGLQPATIQKNITSMLGTVKKPKFNRYKTSRTSKGILVTFS